MIGRGVSKLNRAKIICDSICDNGKRLTTMEVKMHRFVLAEFNTHRVFSRNSASSRAIPMSKIIKRVEEDTAWPVEWGKNQSGMQASKETLTLEELGLCENTWEIARDFIVGQVRKLEMIGLHKQLSNRLLEPWMFTTVIVSSTEWDGFFWQRCSELAQPEIQVPAYDMQYEYYTNVPKHLKMGEWHLPYIQDEDVEAAKGFWNSKNPASAYFESYKEHLKKVSVARCARVSYLTHDGKRDIQKDIEMFLKLVKADPMHASPLEHVATPLVSSESKSGNFFGWEQLRERYEYQFRKPFVPNHPEFLKNPDLIKYKP